MKLAFVGAGAMASAIIDGIIEKNIYKPEDIIINDIDKSKCSYFSKRGISAVENAKECCSSGDIIILAIKPQNFSEELDRMVQYGVDFTKKTIVSIAAGIPIAYINEKLGENVPVIRIMPNSPVQIGMGMSALSKNDKVGINEFDSVCNIFKSLGKIIILDESMMNKVVGINGSSPAYVYLFAKAMVESAVEQGFERTEIYHTVAQSLLGAAQMMVESGKSPDELIKIVASPKGTTEKALASFDADDFLGTVNRAMLACTKRADELSEELTLK